MPVPTDITAGTITITNGSTAVTGAGTSWLASDLRQGDLILWIEGGDGFWQPILQSVESNTALTLAEPWEGPTLAGVRYRIRYQWDSSRVSAQARQLIDLLDNGNLLALSALTGPGVAVFNGPHSMIIKPETDFINGVSFDVQVDTLPDRDAYDGRSAGFTVLVADIGDGRSAVYSKNSNTSGDWSDPAIITGPEGNMPNLVIQPTVTGAPGTDADVDFDPISGGYNVTFTIPAGSGFYWESAYNPALAYAESSIVRNNGSSFIAVQAVPIGEAPSGVFPPVDTAYWEVLAQKGNDGAGTIVSLVAGDGISIDTTDPENPVISADAQEINLVAGVGIGIDDTDPTAPIIRTLIASPSPWINGNMDIWQKGPAMPAPAAVGGYQCDFNGHRGAGSTVFVERKDFPLGQTDVPGYPRYFMRTTVVSVAGSSNYALVAVDIDNVQTFAGSKATVTFYAKADGSKPITLVADQYFGSGGSPSAAVELAGQKITLTTSWQRFDLTFDFPSVSGETVGTSETDTPRIGFIFYLDAGSALNAKTDSLGQRNIVFDLARVSVHADPDEIVQQIADPYNRTHGQDIADCQELMQVFTDVECMWSGYVENGGNRWLGVPTRVPMKRTPVASVTKISATGFTGALTVSDVNRFGAQIRGVGTSTVNSGFFTATMILDANHPYTP